VTYSNKWGKVIKSVIDVGDVDEMWNYLNKELVLNESKTSYNALRNAVDKSAKNLVDASRLYNAAKMDYESEERHISGELEKLRMKTRKELMKDKKNIAGQITKEMIEDQTFLSNPSEYETLQMRLTELKSMLDTFKKLVDAWQSRTADLRYLFDKAHLERLQTKV